LRLVGSVKGTKIIDTARLSRVLPGTHAEVALEEALHGGTEAISTEGLGGGMQQQVRQSRLLPLLQCCAGCQVLQARVLPRHCALRQQLILKFLIPASSAMIHYFCAGILCDTYDKASSSFFVKYGDILYPKSPSKIDNLASRSCITAGSPEFMCRNKLHKKR